MNEGVSFLTVSVRLKYCGVTIQINPLWLCFDTVLIIFPHFFFLQNEIWTFVEILTLVTSGRRSLAEVLLSYGLFHVNFFLQSN